MIHLFIGCPYVKQIGRNIQINWVRIAGGKALRWEVHGEIRFQHPQIDG